MLASSLFWYGKLPNQPEFLSTHTDITLQNLLQTWITTGQNHIGSSLIGGSPANPLYGYGFLLQVSCPSPKIGVLLASHDSVGRSFPFILAQDVTVPVEQFIQQLQSFFIQQNFDFTEVYPNFNDEKFLTQLQQTLADLQALYTYHTQNTMDYWIEFYPTISQLKLTTDKLNPILYRKLMLRGNA